MSKDINDFVLKGIFSSFCIKDLQTTGVLRSPELPEKVQKDNDVFVTASEQIRNSSIQMQRYYRLLYVFENSVREFINNTFKGEDKTDNWFENRANKYMKDKLKSRKASDLGPRRGSNRKSRNASHLGLLRATLATSAD